jgi:2-polyprenyl-6-hydroxyphenyl methylase/3-demethylubiquinone-9 3-methyltransferase
MSLFHDWIDWLGGYPFEVAKPEEIFEFFKKKGFILTKLKTTLGLGCNEFAFRKVSH